MQEGSELGSSPSPSMATETLNNLSNGPLRGAAAEAQELRLLLKERVRYEAASGDACMHHRSESAPPTVEGSLAAVNGLLDPAGNLISSRFPKGFAESEGYESEEQLRSDPAYLAYYYAHVNLNPRLPSPILSWENFRLAQRLKDNYKLRSFDDNSSRSLFASQPLMPDNNSNPEAEAQAAPPTVAALKQESPVVGPMAQFAGRGRSLVDLIQQDFPRTPSPVYSYNHDGNKEESSSIPEQAQLKPGSGLVAAAAPELSSGRLSPFPVAAGNTTRSASAEPSATPAIGSLDSLKRSGSSSAIDLSAALQGLTIPDPGFTSDRDHHLREHLLLQQQQQQNRFRQHQQQQQPQPLRRSSSQQQQRASTYADLLEEQLQYPGLSPAEASSTSSNVFPGSAPVPSSSASSNVFAAAAAAAAMSYIAAGNPYYGNLQYGYPSGGGGGGGSGGASPLLGAGGYSSSLLLENARARSAAVAAAASSSAAIDRQQMYKLAAGQQVDGATLQDALYLQYLQRAADEAALRSYISEHGGSELGGYGIGDHHSKLHLFSRSSSSLKGSPMYYGRSPYYSGLGSGGSSSLLHRESLRSGYGWARGGGDVGDDLRGSVLLEEFKSSKSRRFELSDISGHVVEFSADQHGSRFIQQKLEAATTEEKAMVFEEVLPQAFTLMTDVFGNYVIQKFFEHGNSQQRRELANLLVGHMLELSLQMYGCRVIQKALEVCDVDQQTQLVVELDGHVMRCVRDQNGNHVIQKCIECVPPDKIQFIISAFYGQVLVLSTHPYGCRVIQRVLEHCTDDQKQAGIMEEILGATCSLAQDQYGNYVIQHVLEHGKPHERSEIITKLAGQIVQMSQHKFASNVVEKCLEFGGPAERQILVDEMLGTTDENAPLQAMMKDQFANYVVQKVLETCSDQQREMLLGRIKVHLHALKKYTYGKHIVARVEKLVAAGERRGAAAAAHLAAT